MYIPLYSINFQHVISILTFKKLGEYRTKIPCHPFSSFFIYATKHGNKYYQNYSQKIVAKVIVDNIIKHPTDILWEKTQQIGGITDKQFRSYFINREFGFFIKFKEVIPIIPLNPFEIFETFKPPQSYLYLSESNVKAIENHLTISSFTEIQ